MTSDPTLGLTFAADASECIAALTPVSDTRATERADLLAWLDGDLPVDLDLATVIRVIEAVREGEHVGAAAASRAPNAASRV